MGHTLGKGDIGPDEGREGEPLCLLTRRDRRVSKETGVLTDPRKLGEEGSRQGLGGPSGRGFQVNEKL